MKHESLDKWGAKCIYCPHQVFHTEYGERNGGCGKLGGLLSGLIWHNACSNLRTSASPGDSLAPRKPSRHAKAATDHKWHSIEPRTERGWVSFTFPRISHRQYQLQGCDRIFSWKKPQKSDWAIARALPNALNVFMQDIPEMTNPTAARKQWAPAIIGSICEMSNFVNQTWLSPHWATKLDSIWPVLSFPLLYSPA